MSRLGQVAISVTCALIISREARAQTCLGTAQFSAGVARVAGSASFTGSASFNGDAKEYGGEIAVGANNGVFVSASGGQIVPNGAGPGPNTVGASLGYGLVIGSAAQFCPLVAYTHKTSPEDDISFGGALGATARISAQASIVPYVGAAYVHASGTLLPFGTSGAIVSTTHYGILELGVGLVIDRSITLRPNVSVPFGITGGPTTVGVALGFNFGH